MLPLNFSCSQRFMSPTRVASADAQNNHDLESRVCALFISTFFLVDASFHLLAGSYKSFIGTIVLISRKNPTNYYKEAYSHFAKMLRYSPFVFIGTPLGLVQPNVFQSKNLQEYLSWKIALPTCNQNSQTREEDILENPLSLTSDDDFEDALTTLDTPTVSTSTEAISKVKKLEKELRSTQEEISRLKKLLAQLFSTLNNRLPYNQLLLIKKFSETGFTNAIPIYDNASIDVKKEVDNAFNTKFQMNFYSFCTNPEVSNRERIAALEILQHLLPKYNFSAVWYPGEAALSTVINSFM